MAFSISKNWICFPLKTNPIHLFGGHGLIFTRGQQPNWHRPPSKTSHYSKHVITSTSTCFICSAPQLIASRSQFLAHFLHPLRLGHYKENSTPFVSGLTSIVPLFAFAGHSGYWMFFFGSDLGIRMMISHLARMAFTILFNFPFSSKPLTKRVKFCLRGA